jgi:putative ABC transport system ATP-binding protein
VRFRRENIGFIFQQFNLLPAPTAAENAMVPLLIAGQNRAKLTPVRVSVVAVGNGPAAQQSAP